MNLDNNLDNFIQETLQIGDITTESVSSVLLIGNTIDSKMNLNTSIMSTSITEKKAYYKLYVSEDYKRLHNKKPKKSLACSMIESQFLYYSLIWMFCLKTDIQRAEKIL